MTVRNIIMSFWLSLLPFIAHAGFEESLEDSLGAMINVTAPTSINSQGRGVLSGGNVRVRWRTSNANLVGFTPHNVKSGCNGVDVYGGSLSFVNADQFKQMLRNIGAAAGGYAFSLALNALCGQCAATLDRLQKQINRMNKHLKNSCTAGQFLVNAAMPTGLNKQITDMSKENNFLTNGVDAFTGMIEEGNDAIEKYMDNNPNPGSDNMVHKNATLAVLDDMDVDTWYAESDGDFKQVMLSMTGAIIFIPEDDSEGKKVVKQVKEPPTLNLKDVLYGGNLRLIKCDDWDVCVNTSYETKEMKGIYTMVNELLGDEDGGLYRAYMSNTALTEDNKKLLTAMPLPVGAMIRNLSRLKGGASNAIVDQAISYISMELTKELFSDVLKNMRQAAAIHGKSGDDMVVAQIEKIESQIAQEYDVLMQSTKGTAGLFSIYSDLIKNMKVQKRNLGTDVATTKAH